MSRPILVHLHIPKTGGTALNNWIYCQLADRLSKISSVDGFLKNGIYYYPYGYIEHACEMERDGIQRILNREGLRAILGHCQYGIHRNMAQEVSYITVLRDPVERVLSMYYFHKLVQEKHGTLEGIRMPSGMCLEQYVNNPLYLEVTNGQTRRLSGVGFKRHICPRIALKQAKENLYQHFKVFGLTERFSETIELIKHSFGWELDVPVCHKNENLNKPTARSHSSETLEVIQQANSLDVELYNYASKLFEERIAQCVNKSRKG